MCEHVGPVDGCVRGIVERWRCRMVDVWICGTVKCGAAVGWWKGGMMRLWRCGMMGLWIVWDAGYVGACCCCCCCIVFLRAQESLKRWRTSQFFFLLCLSLVPNVPVVVSLS